MLRTKYISPTFRNMRYKVWMINDAISSKGELIWGDEKFGLFFEFPISSMPAPFEPNLS